MHIPNPEHQILMKMVGVQSVDQHKYFGVMLHASLKVKLTFRGK